MESTLIENRESKIWDIPATVPRDDSVVKHDHITVYEDSHGAGSLVNADHYTFTTNNEDIWLLPSESYLLATVEVKKDDGTDYDFAADNVNLSDNAFNLFEEVRYFINDKEIERIEYPGIATLVSGLTENTSESKLKSIRHSQLWFGTNHNERRTYFRECAGKIQLLLPLNKLFPFTQYIDHAFRGVKHKLMLNLNTSESLIIKANAVAHAKVAITKMEWYIPQVEPSLSMMARLETILSKNSVFHLQWPATNVYRLQPDKIKEVRASLASTIHKPTHVFIACQNLNRTTQQNNNSMIFDSMNMESCNVEVNSVRFPDKDLKCNFASASESQELYDRFLDICKDRQCAVDYETFKNNYPIWHIDVSKHKPELFENTNFPNIVVNLRFREIPAHDYILWVVIYNDREALLNVEQKKMRVIR